MARQIDLKTLFDKFDKNAPRCPLATPPVLQTDHCRLLPRMCSKGIRVMKSLFFIVVSFSRIIAPE